MMKHAHCLLLIFALLMPSLFGTQALATVRQVTHTPGAGQYSSVGAALSVAAAGDTIEIIDNSSPFVESVYTSTPKNFIRIRGLASLNPRPRIQGLSSASTMNAAGTGFELQNLIIERGSSYCTLWAGQGSSTIENCKIDGTDAVWAISSQGALTLRNCEVIGGGRTIQHLSGGPVLIDQCTIRGGLTRGVELLGSGVYTIQNSTLKASAGNTLYMKDENDVSSGPLKVYLKNSVISSDSTGYQDLIWFEQGSAGLERHLDIDQCDITGGANIPCATGTGIVCIGPMNYVHVQNTIFFNFAGGAYYFSNPVGLTGGVDLFCAYKNVPYNVSSFGITPGIASIQLSSTDALYVDPGSFDYRLYASSPAATRNLGSVPQWLGTKGVWATREVTHTPGAGQYATIAAALAAAGDGEVIEIIDNSAPFAENVSVASKNNLVIQGKYGLNPMPTISGVASGTVMTHNQYSANNYVRNLILTAGSANVVLDERYVNPTYQNVVIDGKKTNGANATYTILSQGYLNLLGCTVQNGRNSIEHNYGDLYASDCDFVDATENGVCLLGSGNMTLDRCNISSKGGTPLLLVDGNNVGNAPLNLSLNYSHVSSAMTTSNNLVVVAPGNAGTRCGLTLDHCDFTGTAGYTGTAIITLCQINSLSVTNSIFYKLNYGAYSIANNSGLTGGVEDYCAYRSVNGGNNVASFGIAAGLHDYVMQPYELAYTNPGGADYRLISESPLTQCSSTGYAVGSYGVDERFIRYTDLTHQWEVCTSPVLWNFQNCYNSCVVYHPQDAAYPYKMWFFGNPSGPISDQIYFARSASLTSGWQAYKGNGTYDTTMTPSTWVSVVPQNNAPGAWDNATGDPSVVLKDGVFYMAYSAVKQVWNGSVLSTINSVMAATSTDGINWTRSSAPIIIWEDEVTKCHTSTGGYPADFQGFYHRPSLLWTGTKWRCYFDYYRPVPGQEVGRMGMGYAECTTGGSFLTPSSWQLLARGDNSLLFSWGNPNVSQVGNTFYSAADAIWFWGLGGDSTKTALATSADGINWTDIGLVQPNGRDCTDIPEMFTQTDLNGNGTWLYLFYAWRLESPYGDPPNYKQIRWMRKLIR